MTLPCAVPASISAWVDSGIPRLRVFFFFFAFLQLPLVLILAHLPSILTLRLSFTLLF